MISEVKIDDDRNIKAELSFRNKELITLAIIVISGIILLWLFVKIIIVNILVSIVLVLFFIGFAVDIFDHYSTSIAWMRESNRSDE